MSKSEHDVGITDNRDSRKTPRLTRLLINLAADESDTLRQRVRYSAAIPRTLLYAIDALYVNGVPSLAMVFIESPIFTADVTELLSDEEYAKLQEHLAQRPKAGALITKARRTI